MLFWGSRCLYAVFFWFFWSHPLHTTRASLGSLLHESGGIRQTKSPTITWQLPALPQTQLRDGCDNFPGPATMSSMAIALRPWQRWRTWRQVQSRCKVQFWCQLMEEVRSVAPLDHDSYSAPRIVVASGSLSLNPASDPFIWIYSWVTGNAYKLYKLFWNGPTVGALIAEGLSVLVANHGMVVPGQDKSENSKRCPLLSTIVNVLCYKWSHVPTLLVMERNSKPDLAVDTKRYQKHMQKHPKAFFALALMIASFRRLKPQWKGAQRTECWCQEGAGLWNRVDCFALWSDLGLVWVPSGRSWSALRTSDRWKIVTFFQSSVWSNWDLNGTSMRLSLLSWKTTECSTLHVAIDPTHSTSGVFLNVCPLLLFWPHQPAFYQGSRRHCEYSAHPVSQTEYSVGSIL